MEKIVLSQEKETLLIPLYSKARDHGRTPSLLGDWKAAEIVAQLDYDFARLRVPEKTHTLMCIRARMLDSRVRSLIAGGGGLVVHLGCGLDSRYERLGRPQIPWLDVDYPEVIELRRNFFREDSCYRMVGGSVLEKGWLDEVPPGRSAVVVAEGLLMYLTQEQIRALLLRLRERLGNYTMLFDAYSTLTARTAGRWHPSLRGTGASIRWGIDDPRDLERWFPRLQVTEEAFFTSAEALQGLSRVHRVLYRAAGVLSVARRAHRILRLTINEVPAHPLDA